MKLVVNGLWPRGLRHGAKDVGHRCGKPKLDPWDSSCLHTASTLWNVPGKYGPHGELLFVLLKKEPMVLSELVVFGTLRLGRNSECMCLDRTAHDGPDLGDMWRYDCPKKPCVEQQRR